MCGYIDLPTDEGYRYFVTFIDDYSHMTVVFLMQRKSETLECFKEYHAMATNHFGHGMCRIRCDNGREYASDAFRIFYRDNGIVIIHPSPYKPQLNRMSERMNRTLAERSRSMLIEANWTRTLWGEALRTATFLVNRSPTSAVNGKTPFEIWFGRKPDVSKLQILGTKSWALVREENRAKFDPGSNLHYLVGYTKGGYRLWNPDAKNIRCRDVKFDEICSRDLVVEIPPTSDLPSDEISSVEPADETRVDDSSADPTAVEELDSDDEENFQSLDMNTTQQSTPVPNTTRPQRITKHPARFRDYILDLSNISHTSICHADYVPNNFCDVKGRYD